MILNRTIALELSKLKYLNVLTLLLLLLSIGTSSVLSFAEDSQKLLKVGQPLSPIITDNDIVDGENLNNINSNNINTATVDSNNNLNHYDNHGPTCYVNVTSLVYGCIDSRYHKETPSSENISNMGICSAYADNSCCTTDVAMEITRSGALELYNLSWDQCPEHGPLSDECRNFFVFDQCFYDCNGMLSPYFFDNIDTKTRKTRFTDVPLCYQDCIDWFDACRSDYTCADNWTNGGFDWSNGNNQCKQSCKRFDEWFTDAVHFCEGLFDNSFKVTQPGESCISLNPNTTELLENSLKRIKKDAILNYDCSDGDSGKRSYAYIYTIAAIVGGLVICSILIVIFAQVSKRNKRTYIKLSALSS